MSINLLEIKDENLVKKTARTKTLTICGVTKEYPVYQVSLDLLYNNDRNYRIAGEAAYFLHVGELQKKTKGNLDAHSQYDDNILRIYENKYKNSELGKRYDFMKKSHGDINNYLCEIEEEYMGIVLSDGRIMDGNLTFIELSHVLKNQKMKSEPKSSRYLDLLCYMSNKRDRRKPSGFQSAKKGEGLTNKPVCFNTIILDWDTDKDQKLITKLEIELAYNDLNRGCCEKCEDHYCTTCESIDANNYVGRCVATYRDICVDKKISFEEADAVVAKPKYLSYYTLTRCFNAGRLMDEFLKYIRLSEGYSELTEIFNLNDLKTTRAFCGIYDTIGDMEDDKQEKWKKILFTYHILDGRSRRRRDDFNSEHPFFKEGFYKTVEDELLELSNRFEEAYMEVKNVTNHKQIVECAMNNYKIKHLMDNIIENSMGDELDRKLKRRLDDTYIDAIHNDDSISALGLSVRVENCLKRAGIETVSQLMDMDEKDLNEIKNLSPLGKQEVLALIERLNELK